MKMICHQYPRINFQSFFFYTKIKAVGNYKTIFISCKNIYPVFYCKCYIIQTLLIGYFICIAHTVNINITICKNELAFAILLNFVNKKWVWVFQIPFAERLLTGVLRSS